MLTDSFPYEGAWQDSVYAPDLEGVRRELWAAWDRLLTGLPDTLFHYTTIEGLIGIIQSQRIWATNARYLNDASELRYAADLIEDRINDRRQFVSAEFWKKYYARVLEQFEFFGYLQDYYVSCFCTKPDLLSQWMSYSGRGGGYAIGIRVEELGEDDHLKARLRRVLYDRDRQTTIVDEALKRVEHLVLTFDTERDLDGPELQFFCTFLVDRFVDCLFGFKDSAFAEEEEWRVVVARSTLPSPDSDLRFRSAMGMAVPYVAINLCPVDGPYPGRLPIEKVVIGPTVSQLLARDGIKMLLDSASCSNAQVELSRIPLRDWRS
jgi:hypothetical protein